MADLADLVDLVDLVDTVTSRRFSMVHGPIGLSESLIRLAAIVKRRGHIGGE